jgi:hypothetical protein
MKRAIVLVAVALAIPTSVAFAKAPSPHHPTQGKSAPKVMYVLKGTLSNYLAATSTTDGSISITVTSKTKITNQNGKAQTTVADGTKGMVKFRAPKRVSGDLATALPTMAKAFHVIVRSAS